MDIKKLTLVLVLAGLAGNALGSNNCSKISPAQLVLMAAYEIEYLVNAPSCTPTASIDAATCFQNSCTNGTTSAQLYCYSEYCGGTTCPMSSSQFSSFLQSYSRYSMICNAPEGSIADQIISKAATNGK